MLTFYTTLYGEFTEIEWRTRIEDGQIFLNNTPAHLEDTLAQGDKLEYRRPPWEEPPVPVDIPVLAMEDAFAVFNKPSGIPVLPGGGYLEHTMLHIIRHRYGNLLSPIHRLGRGTSGAILFTRTQEAAAILSKDMREGRIHKTYLALVQGIVSQDSFTVDAAIGPVPHPTLGSVHASNPQGKESISHVRVVERRPETNTSLVEVDIPTGRPHQIRIHLAYAGHPLAGDPLYIIGGDIMRPDDADDTAVPGDCGYLLHSWKIHIINPASLEPHTIVAPPPPELLMTE